MSEIVCLNCGGVETLRENRKCCWCGKEFAWLFDEEFQVAREALATWGQHPCADTLRVEGTVRGKSVFHITRQSEFQLAGIREQPIEFHWTPATNRLRVAWNDLQVELELPFDYGEFEQAWLQAAGQVPPFRWRASRCVDVSAHGSGEADATQQEATESSQQAGAPGSDLSEEIQLPQVASPALLELAHPDHTNYRIFGSRRTSEEVIQLPRLLPRHAVTICHRSTQHCWLLAASPQASVKVNGRRVFAHRLAGGDLIQLGPYAFQFNESAFRFVPVGGIHGLGLRFDRVGVGNIVREASFEIAPGTMVAIVGPSGSGKTTLISSLLLDGQQTTGRIFYWEARSREKKPLAENWSEFRRRVGYVPQGNVIHNDLSPRFTTEFSLRVRGNGHPIQETRIEQALGAVDLLAEDLQHKPVRLLSGGERRRVVVASQVVVEPGLLILDEPTTGLDRQREEQVLRQLRSLSLRGATVLVIIHGRTDEAFFDQVIELDGGHVIRVGPPGNLQPVNHSEEGSLANPGRENNGSQTAEEATTTLIGSKFQSEETQRQVTKPFHSVAMPGRSRVRPRNLGSFGIWTRVALWNQKAKNSCASLATGVLREATGWRELGKRLLHLLRREWRLLLNNWGRRVAVPALIALLFAVALVLAVPSQENGLLGFMMVLSIIWLGTSITHLAIVEEGTVFEFERLSWLQINPYFLAKVLFYGFIGILQTVLFWAAVWAFRIWSQAEMLASPWLVLLALMGVSICSILVGLFISALAHRGRSSRLAGAMLPLFMLMQIVFSVQVGLEEKPTSAIDAYGRFTLSDFQVEEESTVENDGLFRDLGSDPESEELSSWPQRITALRIAASYLTLSRYGDILVRHYGFPQSESPDPRLITVWNRLFWEATTGLIILGLLAALGAWILLSWPPSLRL